MSDVSECTQDELEEEAAMIAVCTAAMTGRLMLVLGELDRRQAWCKHGHASLAHWLAWRTGLELATARDQVRVAQALCVLPEIASALSRGEISYSKARALTRIAKPETEAELLGSAKTSTTAQLERRIRSLRRPSAAEAAGAEGRRELSVSWGDDGMLVVRGRLTAEQGALFLRALEAARRDVRAQSCEWVDTAKQKADALALLADKSLSPSRPTPPASGAQAGRTPGDRTQVVLHVDAEVLADPSAEGRCELADGIAVSAETAQRMACDCSLVIARHGAEPGDINLGRKTRVVSTPLRRALATLQDGKCCFPSCTNPIDEDHHGKHWIHGGGTDLDNLGGLCLACHRRVHDAGYRMKVERGERVFYRPDGRRMERSPAGPAPSQGYLHGAIDRIDDAVDAWTLSGA